MRKYFYIFKTELMSNFQYIFDLVVGFISYAIIIFIYFNLWQYMYSDPAQVINGYSMVQMIWYVTMTEILWMSLNGRKLCNLICDDVRGGNIVYKINKPYSYVGYCLANHLGKFVVKFIIYLILGFLLGFILLGEFPNITLVQFLLVMLSSVFATIISILLITSIGLLAFFIEDSNPFYWIYSKFILVLGTLFPIEFFPKVIRGVMSFSPIFVVSYGPAKLFVDFSYESCLEIFIAQGIYLVICYLICVFIYRRGVKRINVNGG